MLAPQGGCDAVPGAKVEWCGVRCLLESGLFFSCRFTLRRPIVKMEMPGARHTKRAAPKEIQAHEKASQRYARQEGTGY